MSKKISYFAVALWHILESHGKDAPDGDMRPAIDVTMHKNKKKQ